MTLKPPRGFCISFQKIESWFDFARTTDHPERPRTESYSEKKSVSPNNIREVSQEKVGPAAHVKALVFTPFGWVGNSRETSFLRLQHISLHISLSALQGIPPWSSTVCPWKFMVGRWRFIQKWSILRGHSFIFRVKRENPSIWAVHLEVPWFYVTYLLANISIQRSSSSTLLFISGNAKGKAPIGGAYQAPITVALQKDAGKIRTNLLGVGGQTIFSWFMCW